MNKKLKIIGPIVVLVAFLSVSGVYISRTNIPVLEPKGWVGRQEAKLLIEATLLMLIVVIPVFVLLFFISWKYREGNERPSSYQPDFDHSRVLETIWWLIPTALIAVLSVMTWNSSHELDPSRPLNSSVAPITIQAVALNWKWLFIYPQQHIATVNYIQFPAKTPVNFEITSNGVMNSFWIPQLGGQIYAMAGMMTQLHLIADGNGTYRGSSANISGSGFARMVFHAHSSSTLAFKQWVNTVKQSPKYLSLASYTKLAQPGVPTSPSFYAGSSNNLFDHIVLQYAPSGEQAMMTQEMNDGSQMEMN